MFTLKFMRFFEDGTHIENCVHCPHYEARKTRHGEWNITTYPDMTLVKGVEHWVTKEHPDEAPLSYDSCFVENEKGSTITKYVIELEG